MGDLIEFPKIEIVVDNRPRRGELVEFKYNMHPEYFDLSFVPPVRAVAKSSTSVLKASVCQRCGCKLDGQQNSMRPGCPCKCHRGEIR